MKPTSDRLQQRQQRSIEHLGMVQLGVTAGFDKIVSRHGGDPRRVIETSGLLPAFSGAESSQITLGAFSSFLRAAAAEANLPTFSMEFGRAFDVRSLGAIGYLFYLAPDMGTALKDFCTYFELVQDNTEIGIEAHGDLARVVYSVRGGAADDKAPDAEFSVAMLAAALGAGQTVGSDVHRLDLEHRPDWSMEAAPEWLRRDIQPSSASNAVFVPREVLEQPGRANDTYLYRMIIARVSEEHRNLSSHRSLVGAVIEQLTRAFNCGKLERTAAPSIADEFGISTRTLHRRLSTYGASFRELRNTVLLYDAKALLSEKECSVTEVAFKLGFSETSAFSRAFRQWTGLTPVQFQQSRIAVGNRNSGSWVARDPGPSRSTPIDGAVVDEPPSKHGAAAWN